MSGRKKVIDESTLDFFHKLNVAINKNGLLINKLNMVGYDTIKIYKTTE
jgi:hypothetical protein